MVDRTLEELGRVDMLVNNAAFARGPEQGADSRRGYGHFRKVVDIKVAGTFLCTKAAIKPMIEQGGGKIVNISSTAGKRGSSRYACVQRRELRGDRMTQSMAWELGPHGYQRQLRLPGRRRHVAYG